MDDAPEPLMLSLTRRLEPDGTYHVEGQRQNGEICCPRCGAWVPLIEDVDEWRTDTGEVTPGGWGPGLAEHCGLLMVDSWDGCMVYRLEGAAGPGC
jgi:hypothetical protein